MSQAIKHSSLTAVLAAAAMLVFAPSAFADPETTPSTPVQPWYETFTFAAGSGDQGRTLAWDNSATEVEWSLGERWGLTFGVENDPASLYEIDGYSAGAFVNVGSRFRLGGALRFSAPEERLRGVERGERTPEVKFESALRF